MKIGLVRHFAVDLPYPKERLVSKDAVVQWFAAYDQANVIARDVDMGGIDWEICYASDLPRARRTAETIYSGVIILSSSLREIPLPTFTTKRRLPFLWWALGVKLKQLASQEGREQIRQARQRFRGVLGAISAGGHQAVLIVSHGSLMKEVRKELRRQGFRGPRFSYPENGRLYVFET